MSLQPFFNREFTPAESGRKVAMKKRTYYIPIFYDCLLTMGIPLNVVFVAAAVGIREWISYKPVLLLYGLLAVLYWIAVLVLGVANILISFRQYSLGDDIYCVNAMLILKYGLVCFFILNFLVLSLIGVVALIGSRGTILFIFPLLLPVVFFWVAITWLLMLPGSFYGIQVIRLGKAQGRFIRDGEKIPEQGKIAVLHGILQFIFLLDVLDAMYLAVMKWKMGKKSSILVGGLYAAFLAGIATLFFFMAK